LFKYLPRHDDVFVGIAKARPEAQFLLIGAAAAPRTAIFRRRLERVFAAAGLDFARHMVIAEPVPPALFPALLRCGDVYLDSLGWSGGNTTLEAATVGLPIVTMAGPLMRSRHSTAILRQMELDQWVTETPEAFIAAALRLAEPKQRRALAKQVEKRRSRLFNDLTPVRALERFLEEAVDKTMNRRVS
jgi:predicted O-linked N-acetylglucosamine transferase (SPINDLY family)